MHLVSGSDEGSFWGGSSEAPFHVHDCGRGAPDGHRSVLTRFWIVFRGSLGEIAVSHVKVGKSRIEIV